MCMGTNLEYLFLGGSFVGWIGYQTGMILLQDRLQKYSLARSFQTPEGSHDVHDVYAERIFLQFYYPKTEGVLDKYRYLWRND